MSFKARIYIAGPYTNGDVAENVHNAISMANKLADIGFAPFVPHFTHFWHMIYPREYQFWLELDNEFIPLCDGLLRLPGDSNGADKEVKLAKRLKIPIFYSIDELENYYGKKQ